MGRAKPSKKTCTRRPRAMRMPRAIHCTRDAQLSVRCSLGCGSHKECTSIYAISAYSKLTFASLVPPQSQNQFDLPIWTAQSLGNLVGGMPVLRQFVYLVMTRIRDFLCVVNNDRCPRELQSPHAP